MLILEFHLVFVKPLVHARTKQITVHEHADVREAAGVLNNEQEHFDDLMNPEPKEAIVVVQEGVTEVDEAVVHDRVKIVMAVEHEAEIELELKVLEDELNI